MEGTKHIFIVKTGPVVASKYLEGMNDFYVGIRLHQSVYFPLPSY
jgi:hypothetical protein